MKDIVRKLILIFFCLYSLFFFIGSTLAPIMAHFNQYEFSSILTSLYMYSCHQQPTRSFWFLGYPIAICCRCYGFYLGVIISSITALFFKLKISFKATLIIFAICLIDILFNIQFSIDTGNILRFFVGILMGVLFIIIIYSLFDIQRRKNEN